MTPTELVLMVRVPKDQLDPTSEVATGELVTKNEVSRTSDRTRNPYTSWGLGTFRYLNWDPFWVIKKKEKFQLALYSEY